MRLRFLLMLGKGAF